MKRGIPTLLCGLALATGTAVAAGSSFSELDQDGSGDLNRAEAEAAGVDLQQADANGDGKVSKSEFEEYASMEGGSSDG